MAIETTIFRIVKISPFIEGLDDIFPEEFIDSDEENCEIGDTVEFIIWRERRKFKIVGKAVAYVEDNYITGHLNSDTLSHINRSIGQYKRHHKSLKIGITGREPKKRFIEHLEVRNWEYMVVLYRTISERNVKELERFLIDYHYDDLVNKTGGGGGKLTSEGWNYLYILLK